MPRVCTWTLWGGKVPTNSMVALVICVKGIPDLRLLFLSFLRSLLVSKWVKFWVISPAPKKKNSPHFCAARAVWPTWPQIKESLFFGKLCMGPLGMWCSSGPPTLDTRYFTFFGSRTLLERPAPPSPPNECRESLAFLSTADFWRKDPWCRYLEAVNE